MAYKGIIEAIKENEEEACNLLDDFREEIRDKHGLLKLIAFDSIPLCTGAVCGGIARATGYPEAITILPIMSLMTYAGPSQSPRAIGKSLLGWAGYAIGAALPYMDVIFQTVADKF